MTDNSKRTGAAIEAHYQFLAWLVLTIENFPRATNSLLATASRSPRSNARSADRGHLHQGPDALHLRCANLGIEKLRFLIQLAADLRLLDRRRYEHAARVAPTAPAA